MRETAAHRGLAYWHFPMMERLSPEWGANEPQRRPEGKKRVRRRLRPAKTKYVKYCIASLRRPAHHRPTNESLIPAQGRFPIPRVVKLVAMKTRQLALSPENLNGEASFFAWPRSHLAPAADDRTNLRLFLPKAKTIANSGNSKFRLCWNAIPFSSCLEKKVFRIPSEADSILARP